MITTDTLEQRIRAKRLWYNDIEVADGVRTRFAEDYDANPVLANIDEYNRELMPWIQSHLPQRLDDARVLDVGCADGLYSFMAARLGAAEVVGIERCTPVFQQAELLRDVIAPDRVSFINGRFENHAPKEPFDYIFCHSLLYHLVDPLGTLHRLRGLCLKKLIINVPLDLPVGNGEPLSRLDRYATGAHGLWSYNAPMVRQLLVTAGFKIMEESMPDSASEIRLVCEPGEFSEHHIFADTMPENPILNVGARRAVVRETWRKLSEDCIGPVAIFGAGTHTPWLMNQVSDIEGVRVACVLDDRLMEKREVAGLPLRLPTDINADEFSAIVLSSWGQETALKTRALQVFGEDMPIISLTS